MSEEEKKAIKTLKDIKEKRFYTHAFDNGTLVLDDDEIECVETILNLIQKQQEQLQEKDKIIDKLITEITAVNSGRYEYMDNDRVLEIFTKKAREV